jgi:antirestriction protein ArdC
MALSKIISEDKIEIVGEFKAVQVRTKTAVIEDGVELSSGFHRHVVTAGDDYSAESAEVQAICELMHTDAVIAARAASQAANAIGE